MFNSLKKILQQTKTAEIEPINDLQLLCGIMIEAANIDGSIDNSEVKKISLSLIEIFKEDFTDVEKEIAKCLDQINDHKSLHYFTSRINKSFSSEKKNLLIEVLWEIILADGEIHDYESNLIRRLSGLLYISDFECGKIKKKVLEKFN